jgi:hypothetical protein
MRPLHRRVRHRLVLWRRTYERPWQLGIAGVVIIGLVVLCAVAGSLGASVVHLAGKSAAHATSRTAIPTHSPAGVSSLLQCHVQRSTGDDDDETKMTLTCSLAHVPGADTSFSLRFGLIDPSGRFHLLTPACAGQLQHGAGTCRQTYAFIFPFGPVPAPVTGELLPSHTSIGPVTPST